MPAFAANKSLADESRHVEGLTKREFAAISLAGHILEKRGGSVDIAAGMACKFADALLAELEKTE